jgi:hypothetical protein
MENEETVKTLKRLGCLFYLNDGKDFGFGNILNQ